MTAARIHRQGMKLIFPSNSNSGEHSQECRVYPQMILNASLSWAVKHRVPKPEIGTKTNHDRAMLRKAKVLHFTSVSGVGHC